MTIRLRMRSSPAAAATCCNLPNNQTLPIFALLLVAIGRFLVLCGSFSFYSPLLAQGGRLAALPSKEAFQ